MLRTSALALLLAACSAAPAVDEAPRATKGVRGATGEAADRKGAEPEVPEDPARVVFIGASVTAGYGTASELGTRREVDLATFASAFLPGDAADPEFVDHSQRFFFTDADLHGLRLVSLAQGEEPDAVVALDFLFWYAFGQGDEDDPRRERGLENGLLVLEQVEVPLVIGDLPNIDHALRGEGPFGGPIVHRGLFPTEEERLRMNARIRAWAAERDDVLVVSLEGFTADAVALEPFAMRENEWRPETLGEVLQSDLLHPTPRGTLWVALAALDGLARLGAIDGGDMDWDVDAAAERLEEVVEPLKRKRRETAGAGGG